MLAVDNSILMEYTNFPNNCKVLVGDLNIKHYSKIALRGDYAGIASHYTLLNQGLILAHHNLDQIVGSGYARSKNTLYREVNRGVDLIFTNHPWELLPFLP
jgi:glycerophosphoryl diester phosphodiesterase